MYCITMFLYLFYLINSEFNLKETSMFTLEQHVGSLLNSLFVLDVYSHSSYYLPMSTFVFFLRIGRPTRDWMRVCAAGLCVCCRDH